ncbi:MAG: hypothetical protein V8S81_08340 [Oscillospiraceae bacterium]
MEKQSITALMSCSRAGASAFRVRLRLAGCVRLGGLTASERRRTPCMAAAGGSESSFSRRWRSFWRRTVERTAFEHVNYCLAARED